MEQPQIPSIGTAQIPKFKADPLPIEELAVHLLEVSLEELAGEDGEYESRWDMFYNRFGIEVSDFARLINALVPLIGVGKSPLTGKIYKGFAHTEKNLAGEAGGGQMTTRNEFENWAVSNGYSSYLKRRMESTTS